MTPSGTPTSEILRARIANNGNGNGNGASHDYETHAGDAPAAHVSVIGKDILITGNIEAEVDLHIEGRVQGDVRCATLILGEESTVNGSIFAQRVRVSGEVDGSIETVDLAIEARARVRGDVTYSRLRIANGGIISGKMEHVPVEADEEEDDRPPRARSGGKARPTPAKVHYIE